jgi:hypothetical protein
MKDEKNYPERESGKTYESPKIEEHSILDKAADCGVFVRGYNSDTFTYWH